MGKSSNFGPATAPHRVLSLSWCCDTGERDTRRIPLLIALFIGNKICIWLYAAEYSGPSPFISLKILKF